MDFVLTDEQQLFRNMAREFAQRHIEGIAKETDHNEHFPQEVIKQMAPLGLLGLTVPQEHGGLALDYIDYAIVTEEIARSSLSIAMSVFGSHCMVEEALVAWGTQEQKQKYLPAMCQGSILGSCALAEAGAGINVNNFSTKAELDKGQWVITGEKPAVINGGVSALTLAVTKAKGDGAEGFGAFLVDRNAPGFSSQDIVEKSGLRACNVADVYFRGCRLPQESLLGKAGDGAKIAEGLLTGIQFAIAAGCVGAAQACIDTAVKYAEQRLVFGKSISNYDMIQATIADMVIGTEAARLLTYQVGDFKKKGLPFGRQLSIARCLASDVALHSATNAIQIHGAYGFGKEYDVERYFRDIAEVILFGKAPAEHKLAVARSVFDIGA